MPGMDGLELCRAVRQEPLERYVYLMIVTSKNETKDMVQAIAAGADNFLAKPIIPGELLARLISAARILELERRLHEMARCDPLTKLLNRRAFFTAFQQQWSTTECNGTPLSCVMIDVDFFKRINDTYGHPTGDSVLESLGRVLQGSCRHSDAVCRYGGEEFCGFCRAPMSADAIALGPALSRGHRPDVALRQGWPAASDGQFGGRHAQCHRSNPGTTSRSGGPGPSQRKAAGPESSRNGSRGKSDSCRNRQKLPCLPGTCRPLQTA